jgi:hypothetical protein
MRVIRASTEGVATTATSGIGAVRRVTYSARLSKRILETRRRALPPRPRVARSPLLNEEGSIADPRRQDQKSHSIHGFLRVIRVIPGYDIDASCV